MFIIFMIIYLALQLSDCFGKYVKADRVMYLLDM